MSGLNMSLNINIEDKKMKELKRMNSSIPQMNDLCVRESIY